MLVVVDTNVLLSSLISGNNLDLLFSPKIEIVAPELLFIEMGRHKRVIAEKSSLSEVEVEILLSLLERVVTIVPMEEFISFMSEAELLLGEHKKDAPYIALALKLGCPFWTFEKFDIPKVKCVTSSELRDLISI